MFDKLKMLAPFWSIFQRVMGVHRKGEAIKDRVFEKAHQVRSREEFAPAVKDLFNDFYPDGKMKDIVEEALQHDIVKKFQAMSIEDAKEAGPGMAFNLLKEHSGVLQKLLGAMK